MIIEIKNIKTKELEEQLKEELQSNGETEKSKEIRTQLEIVKSAKTLQELNISFEEAVQMLQKNNIPLILTEEDKVVTPHANNLNGLEDLICVHKTNYAPTDSKIKSPKEAKGTTGLVVKMGSESTIVEVPNFRDTVHFTVNGEVTSHEYGDFDSRKYAILIPFTDMPIQRTKGSSVDMYTLNGGPDLTENSYVLCPKSEQEEVQRNNPNVNIIAYEGNSVDEYANAFLATIGYRQMSIGKHGWNEEDNIKNEFINIMEQNGIEITRAFLFTRK